MRVTLVQVCTSKAMTARNIFFSVLEMYNSIECQRSKRIIVACRISSEGRGNTCPPSCPTCVKGKRERLRATVISHLRTFSPVPTQSLSRSRQRCTRNYGKVEELMSERERESFISHIWCCYYMLLCCNYVIITPES